MCVYVCASKYVYVCKYVLWVDMCEGRSISLTLIWLLNFYLKYSLYNIRSMLLIFPIELSVLSKKEIMLKICLLYVFSSLNNKRFNQVLKKKKEFIPFFNLNNALLQVFLLFREMNAPNLFCSIFRHCF